MDKTYIVAAIGTPLAADESLHAEGLKRHLDDQHQSGMDAVLVAGTMGAMQLLTTATFAQLVKQSAADWNGHGEFLVGVGDLSFARTRERLRYANEFHIDGAVVLSPMFFKYSQDELRQYFTALADESRAPVYLYDLPQRTGIALELDTIVQLARHPNIVGIKCSGDIAAVRRMRDAVQGEKFRVIVAQTMLIDVLLKSGFHEHVDGIFCIVPKLVNSIRLAAVNADWESAAARTQLLNEYLMVVVRYGVFPAMTALLNARDIPGNFAPLPHQPLSTADSERLLAEPAVTAAFDANSHMDSAFAGATT